MAQEGQREWLAGDTHIHSHWSPGYDRTTTPPTAILGRDALYPTPLNAQMARKFGLAWMVTTDHGGANHAKLNLTQAYDELRKSRELVPEVLQFYGMELNMPGMDHHTLIIPRADFEASVLYDLESRFDANEAFPVDPLAPNRNRSRRGVDLHGVVAAPAVGVRQSSVPLGEGPRSISAAPSHGRFARATTRRPRCIAAWKAARVTRQAVLRRMARRGATRKAN